MVLTSFQFLAINLLQPDYKPKFMASIRPYKWLLIIGSYPATDCITLLDMSLMLLNKLLAPFTTPPNIAEFPDDTGAGGPLVLPGNHSKSIINIKVKTGQAFLSFDRPMNSLMEF